MRRLTVHCLAIAVGSGAMLVCGATPAVGQGQGAPMTNQTRHALEYYGGRSALRTLSEMPGPMAIQPSTSGQLSFNGKPFQSATSGPTISPYLNLFRDENERPESVPTYFTFVRPQLEQQAASQQQQRELQRLERQAQTRQQHRATTQPVAGTQARFMDTAQFYGAWQR